MPFSTPPWVFRQATPNFSFTAQTTVAVVLCTVHASPELSAVLGSGAARIRVNSLT